MSDTEYRNMRLLTYIMRDLGATAAAQQADRDLAARRQARATRSN
jgi:hypothetical protein